MFLPCSYKGNTGITPSIINVYIHSLTIISIKTRILTLFINIPQKKQQHMMLSNLQLSQETGQTYFSCYHTKKHSTQNFRTVSNIMHTLIEKKVVVRKKNPISAPHKSGATMDQYRPKKEQNIIQIHYTVSYEWIKCDLILPYQWHRLFGIKRFESISMFVKHKNTELAIANYPLPTCRQ